MKSLRDLRKAAGWTQAELASRAGIRQATLSALENGGAEARRATVLALAKALSLPADEVATVLSRGKANGGGEGGWGFIEGLDRDLADGLSQELTSFWTHTSTALEGNTISAGDTLFVLNEGLTISGKSLREHQEIHGHSGAIGLLQTWLEGGTPVRIRELHELHRCVMTGAPVDSLAPMGRWKVEPNGTNALTSEGQSQWHDYAHPRDVAALVDAWLRLVTAANAKLRSRSAEVGRRELVEAYTDLHLGFTAIHPYADGNGRMARLVANLPVLKAGWPPILVGLEGRREYLQRMGDYSIARGRPLPDEPLVGAAAERDALAGFFDGQWRTSLDRVEEFRARQEARDSS